MKLLTLLHGLEAEEHREFEKFLQSPFFRKSPTHLAFFKYLCKHHPAFVMERADWETAYKRCFGKQSFSDQKLYNLLSALSHSVEDFMTVKMALTENGSHDSHHRRELLVKALGMRNMGEHFRSEIRHLMDETAARPVKEAKDYLSLQQLHEQFFFHADTPKYTPDAPDLRSAMDNLDHYYWLQKLRYLAEVKTRERIFGSTGDFPPAAEALEKTADPALQESHPLIAIYHRLVRLYCEGVNETGFRALKALFLEKFELLPPGEQRTLLQHLINCGIYLSGQDFPVEAESLELYKKAIEAGMLLTDGRLTDTAFTNVVATAAICGEYQWARTFIGEFSPYLEDDIQPFAISLTASCLHYYQGELDKAQTFLTAGLFSTPTYGIRARGLLLKIAFDRFVMKGKDYDFLVSHLKAFEKYVKNRQWSEAKKLAWSNYIGFVRKMAALKFARVNVSQQEKQALHSKLERLQSMDSRRWIVEKINSL